MKRFLGTSASVGAAIGSAVIYTPRRQMVARTIVQDVRVELARFEAVRRLYSNELMNLYAQTLVEMGQESANIFVMYRELVDDPMLVEAVSGRVQSEGVNLEYALFYEAREFHKIFSTLEDAYLRERGNDILNVCHELIRRLNGSYGARSAQLLHSEVIVVAETLDPAAVVSFDKSLVHGIVTQRGSVFSHAAILARARGIPTVVCTEGVYDTVTAGQCIALDGGSGEVVLEPDEETRDRYMAMIDASSQQHARYEAVAEQRAVTLDGHEMRITAELIRQPDLSLSDWRMFDGVGLYRTEFIYMTREMLPSEAMQYNAYKNAALQAQGRDVVISLADIGGDWRSESLNFPEDEENPSLGARGVRHVLHVREILHTQLRAILRASAYGRVKLLLPMVARMEELRLVRIALHRVMDELRNEGQPFHAELPFGVLIETPASVSIIDSIVKECDFICIGSTDLSQYTLAVDRTNPAVAHLFDPYDTAVLRSIARVARVAHQEGLLVALGGAAAFEPALLPLWAALGINELVVPPTMCRRIRALVRNVNARPIRAAMDEIMNCENSRETRRLLVVRAKQPVFTV